MPKQRVRVGKVCVVCGKDFEVIPSRVKKATTCSKDCKYKQAQQRYEDERVKLTCPVCGKVFSVPQCHAHKRTHCSNECAEPARHLNPAVGSQNPNWKGGVVNHKDGYLYEQSKDHPYGLNNSSYVLQHRLVIEKMLLRDAPDHHFLTIADGRKVFRRDIEVHHINEIKDDNDESNLVACTSLAHKAFHHKLKANKKDFWPHDTLPDRVIRMCPVCYEDFGVHKWQLDTRRGVYCSKTCFNNRGKILNERNIS